MDGIEKIWHDLSLLDSESVEKRTGVHVESGAYLVPFLNRVYRVAPDSQTVNLISERSADSVGNDAKDMAESTNLRLAILTFLVSGEIRAREQSWITEKEIPGGSIFFQGPHAMPSGPIIDIFGKNAEAFVVRGVSIGGTQSEFGDGSVVLPVLPGIQICIALWEADDEFPASCTFMFDRSFKGMFALDIVLAIVSSAVSILVAL